MVFYESVQLGMKPVHHSAQLVFKKTTGWIFKINFIYMTFIQLRTTVIVLKDSRNLSFSSNKRKKGESETKCI